MFNWFWFHVAFVASLGFVYWVIGDWMPEGTEPYVRWVVMGVLAVIGYAAFLWLARRNRGKSGELTAPIREANDDRVLDAIGIKTDDGELRAACARVARRIHAEKIRVVGFIPADDKTAVPPVIIQLGLSLCDLTGATIAVIDANVRYPGLGQLNRGKQTDSDDSVFSTRWLRGSLALLSPPHGEHPGAVVPQLARVLLDGSDLFAHVLVDLTGFELLGEHGSAAACMDAVALVGRAHHTKDTELLALAPLMPQDRFLGILLVG